MLNWQNLTTLLLDMDGTLLDLNFDNYFWLEHLPKRYAQIHQEELSYVKPQLIQQIMAEQGKLTWYSLDFWSNKFNLNLLELKQEIQHLIAYRADAQEFLRLAKLSGLTVILATNADETSLNLKLPLTGLNRQIQKVYSSANFNAPKEDLAYWQQLQIAENLNPETCLLIDDNESVLATAEKFGIGELLTISQPDTTQAKRKTTRFTAITNFAELNLANYLQTHT